MKKKMMTAALITALLGTTALAAPVAAAPDFGPKFDCDGSGREDTRREDRSERHLARMVAVLDLSDAQQEQIKAIQQASREKTAPLREQLRENREQLRQAGRDGTFDEAAVRELATQQAAAKTELMVERARTRSQIHALLTPEQRERAEKLAATRGAGKGHRGGAWQGENGE